MVNIASDTRHAYENGWLCPKCGGQVVTYRHIGARKWCSVCGYTLREESDTSPYDYTKHLSVGTPHLFISKEVLQKKAETFIDDYLDMCCFSDTASLQPAFLEGFVCGYREAEKDLTKEWAHGQLGVIEKDEIKVKQCKGDGYTLYYTDEAVNSCSEVIGTCFEKDGRPILVYRDSYYGNEIVRASGGVQ